MTRILRPVCLTLAVAASACATTPSPAEQGLGAAADPRDEGGIPAPVGDNDGKRAEARCLSLKGPGVVKRSAVIEVVDQGIGQWLQGVKIERKLEQGKFKGWEVQSLHLTSACYADVDIRPGDVVLTVNGHAIDKPDAAHELWNSLKTAPAIEIDLMRAGQRQSVRFAIAED